MLFDVEKAKGTKDGRVPNPLAIFNQDKDMISVEYSRNRGYGLCAKVNARNVDRTRDPT